MDIVVLTLRTGSEELIRELTLINRVNSELRNFF